VTVEQLFKSREGHLPRLYLLLRHHHFQRHITRINVDEVHNIYTAGLSLYGLDAFRPAWGRLDELKAILPKDTRWSGFSATIPPHILKVAEKKVMRPGYEYIHTTSNRPMLLRENRHSFLCPYRLLGHRTRWFRAKSKFLRERVAPNITQRILLW